MRVVKREDEIRTLCRRYRRYMADRKLKAATLVWHRLSELMTKQLKYENRNDRLG